MMMRCKGLLFVLALRDFPAIILARPLTDLQDDMGKSAYGLCEGDCDVDSDCQFGLLCFQRNGTTTVPGCSGRGTRSKDYCYIPPNGTLVITGNDLHPSSAFPLGRCHGDCDWDGDCAGFLMCFYRQGTEAVPGCTGTGHSGTDYCYDAGATNTTLRVVGNNGLPAARFPLGACQGDCESDDDCLGDLVCFQRQGLEQVPGCTGTGVPGTDYCHVAPYSTTSPPPLTLLDVANNGVPVDAFPLGECQGDCNGDGDCEGTLKCFQRDGLQPVPGCAGIGSPGTDYCYRHYTGFGTLTIVANNGVPQDAYPLQVCQGDCDIDADCAAGLYCYQRGSDSPFVPGCIGSVHVHSDYCINVGIPPSRVTYRPGEATVLMEGLLLSTGLQARKIATVGEPVKFDTGGVSKEVFHSAPDGAGIFLDPSGSGDYVYVSNSESPTDGGVGAIRFLATGQVIGYQRLRFFDPNNGKISANRTIRNCGGGKTYWGTWLTCEEWSKGQVWEVDPWNKTPGRMTRLGGTGRSYESAAYDNRDPTKPKFFITIDEPNGPLVRYSPASKVASAAVRSGDYSKLLHSRGGTLEYFVVTNISESPNGTATGLYVWSKMIAAGNASASQYHKGGEGIDVRDGKLYYTTKTQKYLFIINLDDNTFVRSSTVSGAFDSQPDQVARVLNFANGTTDGILYFCEDGADNCGVHGRDSQGRFFTILQDATGGLIGETTGLAFSPGGDFMYVSFQKPGIIFEIRRTDGLPFYGAKLDIKYHSNADPSNSFTVRRLWNDNAKTCELNAEMCPSH